jgi:radical SAM superfamily enzyme YgiQ (UPF0313 family)
MRIVFFTACNLNQPYQESLPSLGLGYLIACLRRAEPSVEVAYCHRLEDLAASGPDVVGISSTSENFGIAVRAARLVRESTHATTLLGGCHITALPHTLPDLFDIGVLGEGEETILELVALLRARRRQPTPADLARVPGICFHDGSGGVILTAERPLLADLDRLPYPDRDALGGAWKVPYSHTVHLIASRGCPYKCVFCASSRLWKHYRVFSARYVADEIEFLRRRYDPAEIQFFDDLFIGHRERFRQFGALLDERGLDQGVAFRSWARADLVDEELADNLARHHFRSIDLGIESASSRVLEYLGKRGVTPEINQRAIDLLAARGISVGVSLIIGSPTETCEQIDQTYRFVEENRAKISRLGVGILMPLPGTPVWEYAVRRGLVSESMEWDRLGIDFEHADIGRCPILSEMIGREEMIEIFRRFNLLEQVVNARGLIEGLAGRNEELSREIQALQDELRTLKGSRAVRAAMKVRGLLSRLRNGRKDSPVRNSPTAM